MAWASEQTTGSAIRKAVLYAIANHSNKDGLAVLRVETICEEAEAGKTAVKDALGYLVENGLLDRQRKRRGNGTLACYEYQLLLRRPEPGDGSSPEPGDGSHEPGRPLEPGPLAADKPPRERNPVWDALVEVSEFEPTTRSEAADFGKTVSELRAVIPQDASANEIVRAMRARRAAFERLHEGATFTHRCFRGRWGELGTVAQRRGPSAARGPTYPELPEGETF